MTEPTTVPLAAIRSWWPVRRLLVVQDERSRTLTASKTRKRQASPQTLWEAHQAVMAVRPAKAAPDREWHSFRANAAETYSAVAEVDRPHRDEALYWANSERARADRLAERMKAALARGATR